MSVTDVIWCDVKVYFKVESNTASSANDMFYSWKADVFIHRLSNNVYYISVNRDQFLRQQKGHGQHKNVPFNKWQEILAVEDLLSKLHFSENGYLKSSARKKKTSAYIDRL